MNRTLGFSALFASAALMLGGCVVVQDKPADSAPSSAPAPAPAPEPSAAATEEAPPAEAAPPAEGEQPSGGIPSLKPNK